MTVAIPRRQTAQASYSPRNSLGGYARGQKTRGFRVWSGKTVQAVIWVEKDGRMAPSQRGTAAPDPWVASRVLVLKHRFPGIDCGELRWRLVTGATNKMDTKDITFE